MNINKLVGVTDWLCAKLQISTAFFLNVTSLSSGSVAVETGLFVVGGKQRQTNTSIWWTGLSSRMVWRNPA